MFKRFFRIDKSVNNVYEIVFFLEERGYLFFCGINFIKMYFEEVY